VCGDLIGDAIYYWIGRNRQNAADLPRSLAWHAQRPTPALQRDLRVNATRMLCIGKWTHSVGCLCSSAAAMVACHSRASSW